VLSMAKARKKTNSPKHQHAIIGINSAGDPWRLSVASASGPYEILSAIGAGGMGEMILDFTRLNTMEKPLVMPKLLIVPILALAILTFSPLAFSQTAALGPVDLDGWGRPIPPPAKNLKSAPAPFHDISGTWDPANGAEDGGQFSGAKALPVDGRGLEPPYTPLGLEAYRSTKPTNSFRMVLPAEGNDPVNSCEPQGFPRENLFQLRTTQILQMPDKVVVLYEFGKIWRVIWTDGRELPKDPEPRWFGYSVGKWVDDYTLLVESGGMDDRAWVDHAGRPQSAELRVEERFHRVDHDHLEWTVLIDDPKMYTKPWLAMDKFPMRLLPADFDVRELICAPSESAEYDELIGNPASDQGPAKETKPPKGR